MKFSVTDDRDEGAARAVQRRSIDVASVKAIAEKQDWRTPSMRFVLTPKFDPFGD